MEVKVLITVDDEVIAIYKLDVDDADALRKQAAEGMRADRGYLNAALSGVMLRGALTGSEGLDGPTDEEEEAT